MTAPAPIVSQHASLTSNRTADNKPVQQTEADPRVSAVLDVLRGIPLDLVAHQQGVAPELLERWLETFIEGGRRSVGGVEGDHVAPDRFLTVFAHEARTPLTAAIAGLRLLSDERLPENTRAEVRGMIHGRLQHLAVLCEDIVDAASVALAQLDIHLEQIDLLHTVAEAINRHGDPRLRLQPGPQVTIGADPKRVSQIVKNMIDSALQHGMGPVNLRVGADRTHARIVVSDHAKEPVTAEQATAWFDPFDAALTTGFGLSLYVVRALTVAHAGTSGIDSSRCNEGGSDQDLHFWVRLPIVGVVGTDAEEDS